MTASQINWTVADKTVTLFPAKQANRPIVILNNFSGNGESVVEAMQTIGCGDCNLLSVGNLSWDHDMSPWYAPPLSASDSPGTGGADDYLQVLLNDILPAAEEKSAGSAPFVGIAGYSLAGLFALYAMYRTDRFGRVASMSGSLWFPDFLTYAQTHALCRTPDRLYLSLGDREAKTKNPLLKTVQDHTEALAAHYQAMGMNVHYELNPGNHFRDAALRSAKGIAALLD